MKVANLVLTGLVATLAGCAGHRTYSPPSSGTGSAFPSTTPDTTPHLGNPSPGTGSGGSTNFRGPTLRPPEAKRAAPVRPDRFAAGPVSAPEIQTTRYRPAAGAGNESSSADEPRWSRTYRSTDRRPIETLRLGTGLQRVLILGSLHGDETQSVGLVGELARHLSAHPEALRSATVLLVRTANPDGFESRSPFNAHGVDLNRNFPSTNWKTLPSSRAGSRAASEPETRVLVSLLEEFRPALLVHLKDRGTGTVVNSEGNARQLAERVARLVDGQAVQGLGGKTSGSIEDYAVSELGCPSVTWLLAPEANPQTAWTNNREALLSLVNESSDRRTGSANDQPHPFDRPGVYRSSLERPPASPSRSTPELTDTRKSPRTIPLDFPRPVPEQGYFELSAP